MSVFYPDRKHLPWQDELGCLASARYALYGTLVMRRKRSRRHAGASPSGKAAAFDAAMRRFESCRPSQSHARRLSRTRRRSRPKGRLHAAVLLLAYDAGGGFKRGGCMVCRLSSQWIKPFQGYASSIAIAVASPPPMHNAATPRLSPRACKAAISVTNIRAPLAPIG